MRVALAATFMLGALSALTACGEDEDPAAAKDLWNRIHVADYAAWARPADYTVRRPSFTSHERAVDIFVNGAMAEASRDPERRDWPTGATLVKDSYDDDGVLVAVAAMEKRNTGWFFAEWKPNGRVLFSGTPDTCIDCHARSSHDHVWSVP